MTMHLTIIGAGAIGGTIGAHMIRSGHEVLFCDSTGLSAMLLAHREMKVADGATIFIGLSDQLQSMVKLLQLDRVLYIYDTREEAMADLQSDEEETE